MDRLTDLLDALVDNEDPSRGCVGARSTDPEPQTPSPGVGSSSEPSPHHQAMVTMMAIVGYTSSSI